MQNTISTNLNLPREVWKAIKVKAAQEGCSMKDLILEGIQVVLGGRGSLRESQTHVGNVLLKFAGKIEAAADDGSTRHDDYLVSG